LPIHRKEKEIMSYKKMKRVALTTLWRTESNIYIRNRQACLT
jgi:hypothetical protein